MAYLRMLAKGWKNQESGISKLRRARGGSQASCFSLPWAPPFWTADACLPGISLAKVEAMPTGPSTGRERLTTQSPSFFNALLPHLELYACHDFRDTNLAVLNRCFPRCPRRFHVARHYLNLHNRGFA